MGEHLLPPPPHYGRVEVEAAEAIRAGDAVYIDDDGKARGVHFRLGPHGWELRRENDANKL